MAETNLDLALSLPVNWVVSDNKYNEDGKNPKNLRLFVPLESAHEFAQHIMNLADNSEKHAPGKAFDYKSMEAKEVQGFYINAKGKSYEWGDSGMINPVKTGPSPCSTGNCPVPSSNSELPF
tara:strand:+ start:40 stop:405 length:366 start_codon:yes stop_codon:yes gene_type:complete